MTGAITAMPGGAIGQLVVSNPDALTLDMYRELPIALAGLVESGARAVIITGEGRRAFSAGGDIGEFRSVRAAGAPAQAYNDAVSGAEHALETCPVPVIAAVHGACIGGGCGLALACDFRIADTGSRFGVTAARLGLVYGLESTRRLVDTIGAGAAGRLLLTARIVPAEEALRIGLIDEMHETEALDTVAMELAGTISQLSPVSIRGMKRMLRAVAAGVRTDNAETLTLRNDSFSSADYEEGVAAFLAKRPARFAES